MNDRFDYPVTVTVFAAEQYDGPWLPENLGEAVKWLADKLQQVPEQYRDSATIEIGSVSSYEDSHYATITIEYRRPATEAEIAERNEHERRRAEQALEEARRRLLAEERRLAALRDPK